MSAPGGGGHAPRREAYVYWTLPSEALGEALPAMGVFQQALALAAPGLVARLLLRQDDAGGGVATVMETYALPSHPAGLGDALLDHIHSQGDAASAPWRGGTRHVELFAEPAAD